MTTPASPAVGPLRLLLVEDQPLDADLMLISLRRAGQQIESATRVETEAQFLANLSPPPDVILCDYNLPSFNALEALRLLQEHDLDIPFIIISGSIGEETAVEAIKRGADDYLLKDRLGRLGAAIALALEQKQLRDATKRAEEAMRQSEFKYRYLFEYLFDAAFLCDSATARIIDTNLQAERALGLERAQLLGQRLNQFIPAEVWARMRAIEQGPPESTVEVVSTLQGHTEAVHLVARPITFHHRTLLFVQIRMPTRAPFSSSASPAPGVATQTPPHEDVGPAKD